jgi:phage gp36-like protein
VTTPAPELLYASTDALKLVLDSTDAGTGTAAQLSDEQLDMALTAATDRVSLYANAEFTAPVPSLITSLTLDLAAWWATTYYLKQKELTANNPVMLRYTEAMKVLEAARKGEVNLLGPGADDIPDDGSGASAAVGGKVINRIPAIFTGADSNTVVRGGVLYPDTPPDRGSVRQGVLPTAYDYWGAWE